jgi:hypothetical protein
MLTGEYGLEFAMHDCREVKEQITEMVLDDHQDEALLTELNKCAECRAEFDAVRATLRVTARLKETCAPEESYWVGYHARLRGKIEDSASRFDAKAQRRKAESTFFVSALRLCVKTTVPVPVPLMVAVVVAFVSIGLIAIRGAKQAASQTPSVVHVPVEVRVEVPVIQEKVVTRVVYRDKQTSKRATNAPPKVESTFAKFKPTDEVKLTVIKGGSPYEK